MKKTSTLRKLAGGAVLAISLLMPQSVVAQLRQYPTATSGILCYAVYDGSVKDRIYASDANCLFVSEDAGSTWRVAWQLPDEHKGKGKITDMKTFGNADVVFFTVTHASTPEIAGVYSLNHKTGALKHYTTPNQEYAPTAASYDVDAKDPGRMVVYTNYMKGVMGMEYCSEVYLTKDGGETWELIYNYMDHNCVHVSEVAFAPGNSEKIYIARMPGPSGLNGGLLISKDSGKTWEEHLNGIVFGPIAINPKNPDEIILGTGNDPFVEEGLYRSFDGGETWSFFDDIEWQPFITDHITSIVYDPVDPNVVYVFEENEVVYTDDNFKTWKSITPDSYYFGFNASVNPFNTQEILTGASISSDQVMFTSDRYQTWEQLDDADYGEKVTGIAAGDGCLYCLRGGTLYRQPDAQEETTVEALGYTQLFEGSENVVFLANENDGKLAFVDFAGDAQLSVIEGTATGVKAVAADPANAGLYYVAFGGMLAKADIASRTLTPVAAVPDGEVSAVASNGNSVYVAIGSKVYESVDGGTAWREKAEGLGSASIFALCADGSAVVAAAENGVFLLQGADGSWQKTTLDDGNIRTVSVSQGRIAAGSFAEKQPAAIHYSTDNGATWRTISAKELQYAHASAMDFEFASDRIAAHIASADMGRLSYTISTEQQLGSTITQFPYEESFEKGGIPLDWQQTATGDAMWAACAKAEGSPSTTADGSETKVRFSGGTASGQARLITPCLDLSGLDYPVLSFSYAVTAGKLKIYSQNAAGSEWAEIPFEPETASDWRSVKIALPEKSAAYRIAFEAESAGNADIQLDGVEVCNGDAQAFNDVRSLSASIVYGPEATISWTAPEGCYDAVYNVYRDSRLLAENTTASTYKDSGFDAGEHTWTVKAIYNGVESKGVSVAATYTGEHTPVSGLAVEVSNDVNGNAVALLSWSVPEGYSSGIYNVYRGSEKVAENLTATAFADTNIPNGSHVWSVAGVYGDKESEAVAVKAEVINRCAPVRSLKAEYDVAAKKVALTWEEPCDLPADYISQAAAPVQAIGYNQEGEWRMTIAVRWSAAELQEMGLDGAKVTEIAIVPWCEKAKYYPKLWTGGDGNNAGKEAAINITRDGYSMNVREWNSIPLNSPVAINAKEELWIGYQVNFTGFDDVIGCDAGPEKQGVNKITDGTNWYDASDFDPAYKANFCIAARIETVDGKVMVKRAGVQEDISYNIYRDNELLTNTTETSYEESGLPEDYYTYSITAVHGLKGESAARAAELFAGNLCPEAENVTATADAETGDVTIMWDAAEPYYVKESTFSESFDNGIPATWTLLDKDGDGANWASSDEPSRSANGTPEPMTGKAIFSDSKVYNADYSQFTMSDNWIVSPAITLKQESAELRYYVSQLYWASWETYYEVLVGTDYDDFTKVFSETLGQATDSEHVLWYERAIDLSEYAGSTLYIAFRHKYVDAEIPSEGLQIDELAIVEDVPVERKYNVYRDGEPLASLVEGTSYVDEEAAGEEHRYCVMTMCEDLGYESNPACVTTAAGGVNGITSGYLSVYPNPATDFIHIGNNGLEIGIAKLLDMSGRTVGEYDFSGQRKASIDVSAFEDGVYFLTVGNSNVKIIKR